MKWLQLILNAFLRYQQGRTLIPRNIEPLLGLLASILVILIAVANSIAIGYALIVVWSIMAYVFYRKGYALKRIIKPILDRCENIHHSDANLPPHRLAHRHVASSRRYSYDYRHRYRFN